MQGTLSREEDEKAMEIVGMAIVIGLCSFLPGWVVGFAAGARFARDYYRGRP